MNLENFSLTWLLGLLAIILGIVLILFLLVSLAEKTFKYKTYKHNAIKVQKGELIRKKMFKCSDNYELKWNGEINPEGKNIIIYVHDTVGSRSDADNMLEWFLKKDRSVSVVSYDQRYVGENLNDKNRNYGANLSDLREIISEIKDKHPSQKLVLVGHGFGANLAISCINEPGVDKVIAAALKVERGYKYNLGTKMTLFWSWIFSANSLIKYPFDSFDLSDDKKFIEKLEFYKETNSDITCRQYYQTKSMIRFAIKQANKSSDKKLVIMQPAKSIYASSSKLAKVAVKFNNAEIETFADLKHHLFNTIKSEIVFEKILEIIS